MVQKNPSIASALSLPSSLSSNRLFWIIALIHLALWTIVPLLVSPNAPLDVIEGYAWGHEWPWGTYKHPPLQAWILEALASLTDRANWAHFLASQLAVIVALWAVWQTGLRMMNETRALLGVLLLEGIVFYNYTSTEFNPNILQLPFWALTGLYFHRAVKDNRLLDWMLLGLWGACGLYSKYSTVLLLASAGLLLIAHADARKRLKGAGPYLALLTTFVLFLPHLVWLINNHFLPLAYIKDRFADDSGPLPHCIVSPFYLICGQFVTLLPIAFLFITLSGHKDKQEGGKFKSFDRAFLKTFTFLPFILTFLMAAIFGFRKHDMWCAPYWNFLGLWLLVHFRPRLSTETLRRFAYMWGLLVASTALIYAGGMVLYPYVTGHAQRINFPGQALADKVTSVWHQRYNAPLRYVVGDVWPAGNIAYYTAERPHVFISADPETSPWIDRQKVVREGGVLVWCIKHCLMKTTEQTPDFVAKKFPTAEIQPQLEIPRQTGADLPPVIIGWAIVPPQPRKIP
jgi:4-amino-4-deoxy-L-arabinose transferase-like glycosyltransferase